MFTTLYNLIFSKKNEDKKTEIQALKDSQFDAGDLFTPIPPRLDYASFSNVEIEEKSSKLLKIAFNQKTITRFAIVDVIEEKNGRFIHHLLFQPSLPSTATPIGITNLEMIYGHGQVVQAEAKLTGVVHPKTLQIHQAAALLRLFLKKDHSKDYLLGNNLLKIGLSCYVDPISNKNSVKIIWIARSTMQYDIFKLNEIAEYCFLFDRYTMQKNGHFAGRKYTDAFNLERSLDIRALLLLTQSIKAILDKQLKAPQTTQHYLKEYDDVSINYHTLWQTIRHDQESLARYLEITLYVIAGLEDSEKGPFWPDESDVAIATYLFDFADELNKRLDVNNIPAKFKDHFISKKSIKYLLSIFNKLNIHLNINHIPTIFKNYFLLCTPILLAIETNKEEIVRLFIEKGAHFNQYSTGALKPINILSFAKETIHQLQTIEAMNPKRIFQKPNHSQSIIKLIDPLIKKYRFNLESEFKPMEKFKKIA
jgi:hypothetical protein